MIVTSHEETKSGKGSLKSISPVFDAVTFLRSLKIWTDVLI